MFARSHRPATRLVGVALFLVFAAAACDSGSRAGSSPHKVPGTATITRMLTARQVGEQLSPLGCHATPKDTSHDLNLTAVKPLVTLTCTIDGEAVTIQQYANPVDVSEALQTGRNLGCPALKQSGGSYAGAVIGDAWTVSAATPKTNRQMAAHLPGRYEQICGPHS